MELEQEAEQATELLKGKVVQAVWRHSSSEVGIQFADGTRLFVASANEPIELSITGNR